ncbi:MAG: uroporphyrinogen-III synthase [Lysobacter sp.]|nr:uroporphyrinogen-III synthase [Lysobacter sp.]
MSRTGPTTRRSPREYYTACSAAPLVVSLRPANDHAAMRRAAAAHGWRVAALSPWKIAVQTDTATRATLRAALAADIVIATSPAAVRAAVALSALRARRGQLFCAVGSATAAALRRAGVADVLSPERMDSDGLLALSALRVVHGRTIGLLTAPGGRDLIAPTLRERGAQVQRADVYARERIALSPASLARLRAFDGPLLLPVSSGEALQQVFEQAPTDIAVRLRDARVLAASERLAALARTLGCDDVRIAAGPRPAQLLAAATTRSG